MWPNPQKTVDLVTFTEEIEKFIFCAVQYLELCRVISRDLRKEKGKGQVKVKKKVK